MRLYTVITSVNTLLLLYTLFCLHREKTLWTKKCTLNVSTNMVKLYSNDKFTQTAINKNISLLELNEIELCCMFCIPTASSTVSCQSSGGRILPHLKSMGILPSVSE